MTIIPTEDGSPTARLGAGETMHSLRGAFGETVYIYGTALDRARDARAVEGGAKDLRVLSLGLGLGYVEMLSAAYAIRDGRPLQGESFEYVDDLTNSFKAWLFGENEVMTPHSVYDEIERRTHELAGVQGIRETLADAVRSGQWLLRPAMEATTSFTKRFHCVAFDAFSSKSTPELWTREFLDGFLRDACDNTCILSTYACTGHLKRALKDAGFELEIREGYASKRDSTLATRRLNA